MVLGSTGPSTIKSPEVDTETKTSPERLWNVIVWNDPVNLMSYVTFVFQRLFGYSLHVATRLMLEVHNEGRSIVATVEKEKAEYYVARLHQFGLERHSALERAVREYELAETVDGEDCRAVEVEQSQRQATAQQFPIAAGRQQPGAERVVGRRIQRPPHLKQPLAATLAQLRGGGARIGDDQDLRHRQSRFEQQTQIKAGDGEGLTGAGAGLDQVDALQRRVEQLQPLQLSQPALPAARGRTLVR